MKMGTIASPWRYDALWPPRAPTGKSRTACDFVLCLHIVFSWPHQGSAGSTGPAMADTADTANVIVRPPIAWALAVLAGLELIG